MAKCSTSSEDFFVIRTPRLTIEELLKIPSDLEDTRQYIIAFFERPEVIEAVYLASPSLLSRIETLKKTPNTKQSKKIEKALLKYMIRMCTRPTPFGLFSGVSLGVINDDATKIVSHPLTDDRRHTRLDISYLDKIKTHLQSLNPEYEGLKYYPNTTHYFIMEQCRYIESYQSNNVRHYRLSEIETDEYFLCLLELSKKGISFSELAIEFITQYPQITLDEISDYIKQLISESVLIANIPLPLTGPSTDLAFIESLKKSENNQISDYLTTARDKLDQIDHNKTSTILEYRGILDSLNQLPVKAEENKLFQTDVYRSFEHCNLDTKITSKLIKQLTLIHSLNRHSYEPFSDFIQDFNERYEGQYVPLQQVLDDESGIGFSNETGYETSLLAGLNFENSSVSVSSSRGPTILDLIIEDEIGLPTNRSESVIKLTTKSLIKHVEKRNVESEMAASFSVIFSLYNDKNNQPILRIKGCDGPSGVNMLGRFCHLDNALKNSVIDHIEKEEAHSPDALFAEVVHMPDGRPGNVIARPHLRKYEIVFMADSVLDDEYQIPLSDLYVWVEADEVKLWSKRLQKQIVPRLSCSHNYSDRSLSAYRFLSEMQKQSGEIPNFSLPASQSQARLTPRIMLDNLILSEKTWRIPREEVVIILKNDEIDNVAWQTLKHRYCLDDWVMFSVGDNVLQLNLTNALMFDVLLTETVNMSKVELKEVLTEQFPSSVVSPLGEHYNNEFVVPLFNEKAKIEKHYSQDVMKKINPTQLQRRFIPGSEWMSLKIYSGNTNVENLLSDTLFPFIQQNCNLYDKWFFIRYGDPKWHIRLRFYGTPELLYGQLLPLFNHLLGPMVESNLLHKVEMFTYEREVERYGGPEATALIESLFMADSELISMVMAGIDEHGDDLRWRVTLLTTDMFLDLFECSAQSKLDLITLLRNGFGREFGDSGALRKQMGSRFRDIESVLNDDFDKMSKKTNVELSLSQQYIETILTCWNQQVSPLIEKLLEFDEIQDDVLGSLLHMHNNRMFKDYNRKNEFVMHDFLRRVYFAKKQH